MLTSPRAATASQGTSLGLNQHPRPCKTFHTPALPYHLSEHSHITSRAPRSLPDRDLADFIRRGTTKGFRIGILDERHLQSASWNLKSADDNPQVISVYLEREVALGRLCKLYPVPSSTAVHISPFGAIPKKHRPNKWRLIVDLSSPAGHSVNDAIVEDMCSVTYASLDQAVKMTQALDKGCLLAKLDLKEAYRAVPVHPSDQRLIAVQWNGETYIDRALPFGLRSAPKLFSALTDAMMWFLYERGVEAALHYLDDFLLLGPPSSVECAQSLSTTLSLCEELGFPVAPEKTEGPTTVLTFLGIELDTSCQVLRLPYDKWERLLAVIQQWLSQSACPAPRGSGKKRDLLSLLGLLSHAAVVVRPGRAFLHSLFDAAAVARELDHWVHLNKAARADLSWWHTFLHI